MNGINDQIHEKQMDDIVHLLVRSAAISGYAYALIKKQVEINRLIVSHGGDARRVRQLTINKIVEEQEEMVSQANEILAALDVDDD